MSQSTVSIHLKNLEGYFGVKLLERQGRTAKPTFAGATLYKAAQEAINGLDEVKSQILDITHGSAGYLGIGVQGTLGTYILPEITKSFLQMYPGAELSIQFGGARKIEESVLKGQNELGISLGKKRTDRLTFEPYFTDHLIFIASTQNNTLFQRNEPLGPKDLENHTLIIRKTNSSTRSLILNELKKSEINFKQIVNRANLEQVKEEVLNSASIAVISRFAVQEDIEKGLFYPLNIADLKITRPIWFIYRKDRNISPLALNFAELCRRLLPEYLAPPV